MIYLFAVVSVMPLSNVPQLPTVTVNVNRPFSFFIINRATKSALFSGLIHNVVDPTPVDQRINFDMKANYEVPKYQQAPSKPSNYKN